MRRRYYDREFCHDLLPGLERRYRALAESSTSREQERAVVQEFLSNVPSSHLALYSRDTHELLMAELFCNAVPSFGCQLKRLGDEFFIDWVFEGGPADRAGLHRGDRVVEIDGQAPLDSARLDWRSDDAALPDPPLHALLCDAGDEVELRVERAPGLRSCGRLAAVAYSGCDAARASARVIEDQGRFGYVHLWFIAANEASGMIGSLLDNEFAECDGLLLDLRGRGGHASEISRLTRLLAAQGSWGRPVVLLTDAGTRSAKEVIAYRMQASGDALVVGERTAGAVIPATFERVGDDAVLMFPSTTLGRTTRLLEGRGVNPDVEVSAPLPFSDGADPILEAGIIALQMWVAPH
ncbi:MAG: carboxyl-terminal processing protease [Chlamydiales bacterium]|jgi:carboxyl-terminal processing protease